MPVLGSKKAQRLKESRGLRAKAPIAAQFEDCFQSFQQLSDSLQFKPSNLELYSITKECGRRLKTWGEDSGASSRALDYALKNSIVVKQQTLRLLTDLHSILDDAIAGVRLQDPDDTEAEAIEATATSKSPNVTSSTKFDAAPDDQDAESGPDMCLEEANDIINYLVQLLPALQDPLEEDNDEAAAHDIDDYSVDAYRRLATLIFPQAPAELWRRLGQNNWRRRRNVPRSSSVAKGLGDGSLFGRRIKSSFAPWDRPPRRIENLHRGHSQRHQSNLAESDAETSTARSHVETVLSKTILADQDSFTSATDTPQPHILQRLVVPQPPVDLAKNEQFDCPYCHSELPLAFTTERMGMKEWAAHVHHDLKSYMCTFDDCFHEYRPFGDREEWFQHELDFHRSQLIWFCGLCRLDFDTGDQLKAHLQSSHDKCSADQLTFIQDNCRRYSKTPLSDQPCVLCGSVCQTLNELESHLGEHLETFALATLLDREVPDDEELEGDDMIVDYITELQQLQEHNGGQGPGSSLNTDAGTLPSAAPVNSEASHMLDTSEPSGLDELEVRGELWTEKVQKFLDKQTTQDSIQPVRYEVLDRYDNFVGRDVDLENIHKHISTPGRICTVSGRGGIGKTALAVEYVYKYDSEYSYVFWIGAENAGSCAEKYGMIASTLNLVEKPLADEDARTYLVRESLTRSERRWLLIFDNVALWADIARYIPRNLPRTKGSVLITTRSAPSLSIPTWLPVHNYEQAVELDVWPLQHGREFLLTSINPRLSKEDLRAHDEYEYAAQVVEVVGRLPLAISMIVGYVKVSRCTLADFLEMWEEKEYIKKKRTRYVEIDESDIDTTIDSLWTIGIREVRMNSRRLLDILSFLDPDNIQKSLLVGDHKEEYLEFLNASETLSYRRMINELSGRRLVNTKETSSGEPAYTIHRLLQQKILLDMEDYGFADAFRKAFRLIRKRFPIADPQQVPTRENWADCQEYMPHIFTFCRIFNQNSNLISTIGPNPVELAELFYDAGFYIWARQTTAYDGLAFLETAQKILEEIQMDPNAKIRADILCLTGLLLISSGCVERVNGLDRLRKAWQIRRNIYEKYPEHDNDVLLQNAANDYSLSLLNEHLFDEAGKMISECHDRYLVWGPESENPFENSKYYGNYSTIHMWNGDMVKAIEFQEKCLMLIEQFSGRMALYYRRAFMLACILLQSGNVQSALDKHLEVLTARLELHGKHHEHTILSMYAVGAMYHHLGDLNTATEYIQQCIECVKSSTWDRAALARAQYHLSLLYEEQDIEHEAAAKLKGDATKILDQFGGYAAECVRDSDDKMMILDDLQPTFIGRYTGRNLLKHLQKCLRGNVEE